MPTKNPITKDAVRTIVEEAMAALDFTITATVNERNHGEDWSIFRNRVRATTLTPHSVTPMWKALSSWSSGSVLDQWYVLEASVTDEQLTDLMHEFDTGIGPNGKIRLSVLHAVSNVRLAREDYRMLHVALLDKPTAATFKLKHPLTK